MLRAVRFAARLGFEIEAGDDAGRSANFAQMIAEVSAERVRDELSRILTEGGARRGFELLDETGLLGHVLPEVAAMKGVQQPPEFHPEGDVWTHTLMMLEGLGALFRNARRLPCCCTMSAKPGTLRFADRIRFDGHAEESVRLTRRDTGTFAVSERRDRAGGAAGGQPHAVQGRAPNARKHAETIYAACRAFEEHMALAPPGLSDRATAAWELRLGAPQAGRDPP